MKKPITCWRVTLRALGFKFVRNAGKKLKQPRTSGALAPHLRYEPLETRQLLAGDVGDIQIVDRGADWNFQYTADGDYQGGYSLEKAKNARGAATSPAGDRLFVINSNKRIYVFDTATEEAVGYWRPKNVSSPEGIATDGNHIWIVDKSKDRVVFFENAASRTEGKPKSTSHFDLVKANRKPTGITTDGETIWVSDEKSDQVFVYQANGNFLGSWSLDPSNRNSTGIAIDPSGGDEIWVLDEKQDQVFVYQNGRSLRSGNPGSDYQFELRPNNRKGEGIAILPIPNEDPPSVPVIGFVSDDSGFDSSDGITNDSTLLISGTADPGSTVTISESTLGQLGSTIVNNSGNWTVDLTANPLTNGTYAIIAIATEGTLSSTPSATFEVVIDTAAPINTQVVRITEDTGIGTDDGVTRDDRLIISGESEPNVFVQLSESALGELQTVTSDGAGNWSVDLTSTVLPDGTYQFSAIAIDLAGNRSILSSPLEVAIDTTAPLPPVIAAIATDSGFDPNDGYTNDNTLTFSGTAESGSIVWLSEPGLGMIGSVVADPGGNWVLNATDVALAERAYTFTVTSTDLAGNVSPHSAGLNVEIDLTDPQTPTLNLAPEFDSAPLGDRMTTFDVVTLIGQTEPGATVTLTGINQSVVADSSGGFAFPSLALSIGENNFTVTSEDLAGNQSQFTQTFHRIEVVSQLPQISAELLNDTGSSSRDLLTADPSLVGTIDHPTPVTATFVLFDAGPNYDTDFSVDITSMISSDGSFVLSRAFWESLVGQSTLPTGPYRYSIQAIDIAGNLGKFFGEFKLVLPGNDSPPISTGIGLLNDTGPFETDKLTTDPTLTGFVEGIDIVSVEFIYDSAFPGFTADITSLLDSNGDFVLDQAFLENLIGGPLGFQRHSFRLVATDAAGNFSFKFGDFGLLESDDDDITPPVVTFGLANDTGSSDNDLITSDVSLSGTIEDESEVEAFLYFYNVDGLDDFEEDVTNLVQPDGSFEVPQSLLEQFAGGTLVPGQYYFEVYVQDRYSSTSDSFVAQLAGTPATPTIDSIDADTGISNSDGITNDSTLTVIGTAGPDSEVELSEIGLGVLGSTRSDDNGRWEFEITGPGLIDGDYSFTAVAVSAAGQTSQPSDPFEATLDTDSPLRATFGLDPEFDSGELGDDTTMFGVVTLVGSTTPGASVRLVGTGDTTVADANGNFVFEGVALSLGRRVYEIETSDVAGNTQSSKRRIAFDQPLELTEDSFVTEATRRVELGQDSGSRIVTFRVAADFGSGPSDVEDSLQVYLVDPSNPSETLLDRGQEGTSLFSLVGDQAEFIPGLVRFDGELVQIDVSSLAEYSEGWLVFQLINNDSDSATQISINELGSYVDELTEPSPVFEIPLELSPGAAIDTGSLSNSSNLNVIYENIRYDTGNQRYTASVRVRNDGPDIGRTIALTYTDLSPDSVMLNPSGIDSNGKPYVNLRNAIPSYGLLSGQTSDPVRLEFTAPTSSPLMSLPVISDAGPNTAPILDPIGTINVNPGDVARVPLSATDPDGEGFYYLLDSADQLPNLHLTAKGELVIAPGPDQIGSYSFEVVATDGVLSSSQPVTLNVVQDLITTTRLSGYVMDTNSVPLAGIPVELGNGQVVTDTNGYFELEFAGTFPSDTLFIRGEAFVGDEVYPFIAEKLPLLLGHGGYDNVNNFIERPIYLPALDVANGVTIDPNVDVTVTTATIPNAAVFVAAGSLDDQSGNPFSGQLSITEVPADFTPAALPPDMFPDLVVTIQPGEMVFTTPAPLNLPNLAGYFPGTEMTLWSINPTTGLFDDVGVGVVSGDGSTIETISGGINNSSWHFFSPSGPAPIPPEQNPDNEDKGCDDCEASNSANQEPAPATNDPSSSPGSNQTESGSLLDSIRTPGPLDTSFMDPLFEPLRPRGPGSNGSGRSYGGGNLDGGWGTGGNLVLPTSADFGPYGSYDMRTGGAKVTGGSGFQFNVTPTNRPLIQGDQTHASDTKIALHSGAVYKSHDLVPYQSLGQWHGLKLTYDSERADARPIISTGFDDVQNNIPNPVLITKLTVRRGDVAIDAAGFTGELSGLTGGENFFEIPSGSTSFRAPVQVDLRSQPSGVYEVESSNRFAVDIGGRMVGPATISQSSLVHVNTKGSSFGAGWGLAGLTELVENPDGSVLLIDGDGGELLYQPPAVAGQPYSSPPGDFSTLTRLPDGRFQRTHVDQTIEQFSSSDKLLTITDRNGNQTQFQYNTNDQLERIVDPTGLTTTLRYLNGKVSEIEDPANRITKLNYENDNLVSIEDPDATSRQFSYDSEHRLIGETDKLGATETIEFGFSGRVESVTRKDGTTLQYSPAQTKALYRPDQTRSLDSLVPALGLGQSTVDGTPTTTGQRVDANGNVTEIQLDRQAQLLNSSDAAGNLPEVERNSDNLVERVYDGRGNLTTISYDSRGNTLSILDAVSRGDRQIFAAGNAPESLVTLDVNLDGWLDVATANIGAGTISVLLGDGDGNLGTATDYEAGNSPASIASADFDGDGFEDLVVVNFEFESITILFADGLGGFSSPTSINTTVASSLSVGDLDNDGDPDILVGGFIEFSALVNQGDGTFSVNSTFDGSRYDQVELADFDNDGILDLASGAPDFASFRNNIMVSSGNGDGTFSPGTTYNAGGGTDANVDWFLSDLTTADLDGDGNSDIIATTPYTNDFLENNNVSVLYGNGDNTFADAFRLNSGVNPRDVEIADVDGDLIPDIVTANRDNGETRISYGAGDRSFGASTGFQADAGTNAIGLGDFNGDGLIDVVAANTLADNVSIHLNGAGGQYFEYDPVFSQLTKTIDGEGRVVSFEIDPSSGDTLSMTQVIGELGGGDDLVTLYSYTTEGLLDTTTDPLGRVTDMDYNSRGLLERITFAVGTIDEATMTFEYDLAGNRTAVVDELGHRTEYTYDAMNRVIEVIEADPDGNGPLQSPVTTNVYDEHGNLTQVTDAENQTTRFVFDAQHRLIETIDSELGTIKHEYDEAGNLIATEDRLGRRTEFVYDARNRLVETVNAAGGRSQKTYDADNNVTATTDENGIVTHFEFDARNRLVSTTNAIGGINRYEYDLADNLVATVDELGRRTELIYDDVNRVVEMVGPDPDQDGSETAPVTNHVYDDASNLVAVTDALGNTTLMVYDARDRLVQQTDPDPDGTGPLLRPTTTYDYDDASRIVRVTDPLGRETRMEYDDLNRLIRETLPDPDGTGPDSSPIMAYAYDAVDNRISMTDALGNTTITEYDGLYRVVSVTAPDPDGNGPLLSPVTNFAYDAEGQVLSVIDPLLRATNFEYDNLGRLVSETHPDPDGSGPDTSPVFTYEYDAVGNEISMTDALGNATLKTYDDVYRLAKVIGEDPDGVAGPELNPVTILRYDPAHQLISSTDPLNRTTQFEYDDLGRVVRQTLPDPDGIGPDASPVMTFVFDLMNNQLSMTDALGNTTSSEYDNLYRLVTLIEADPDGPGPDQNPVTRYAYDVASQLLAVTDPLNRMTQFEYDELGRVVREISPDPDGAGPEISPERSYLYDLMNNELAMTDALGNTTESRYDNLYRLVSVVQADPDGGGPQVNPTTTFVYDVASQLTSTVDPLGRTTGYFYDALGRVIQEVRPDPDGAGPLASPEMSYIFDLMGNELAMTDAVGNVTSYEYDQLYRLTRLTEADPDGAGPLASPVTAYSYDLANQLLSATDPLDRTTTNEYDQLGRVVRTVQPDPDGLGPLTAPEMSFVFDLMNNQLMATDPVGNTTSYVYDNLYRMIQQVEEDLDGAGPLANPTTDYAYDLVDNLLSLTDSSGNRTDYQYDDLDRVFEEAIELGPGNIETRRFEYDLEDNLIRSTDRNDRVIEYDYDAIYRVVEERWLDSLGAVVNSMQFDFDEASQMLRAEDLTTGSRYDYSYDNLSRVIQSVTSNGGPDVVFDNAFDAQNRRIERTATIGGVADYRNVYAYDGLNRLSQMNQVGQPGGNTVADKRFEFAYNADDQFTLISRYHDVAGGAGNRVMQSVYDYDGIGRMTELVHSSSVSEVVSYDWAFDAASRITQFTNSADGGSELVYDNGDQVTSVTHSSQPNEAYQYDEDGNRTNGGYTTGLYNRLSSDGVYDYQYDAEGNRTRRTQITTGAVTEYEWDHRNRLVSVVDRTGDGGPISQVVEHRYDVFNRWISKSVDADGDGPGGFETTRYHYDGNQIVLAINDSSEVSNRYVWGPATDQLLADEQVGNQVYWTAGDHLGTIRDLVNSNGNVVNHIVYDSFGNRVSETNTAIDHLFGYTGRPLDEATGLQNNLNRWYESTTGRWLSEDPISFNAGDSNLYRYVGNDAFNLTDPDGLDPDDPPGYFERFKRQLANNIQGWATATYEVGEKTIRPIAGDMTAMTTLKMGSIFYSSIGKHDKAFQLERVANTIKQNSLLFNQTADLKKHIRMYGAENTRARLLKYLEFARLSADVYKPIEEKMVSGTDYVTFHIFRRDDVGFQAAIYQNIKTCKYVVVFRGTQEAIDWRQNAKQGAGFLTEQYEYAIALAKAAKAKYGEENVTLAGHSLGGGLASAASMVSGLPAYVVDSAGVHFNTVDRHGADFSRQFELIHGIRLWGEFLTTTENALSSFAAPNSIGNLMTIPTDRDVVIFPSNNPAHPQVPAYTMPIDHHGSILMVKMLEKLLKID